MKEIDWEERHFQICLALLSCPSNNSAASLGATCLKETIKNADRVVELLKEHALQSSVSETKAPSDCVNKKRGVSQRGLWSPAIVRSKLFSEIWAALEGLGYTNGSDIPYFHFNECCEDLNIDVDAMDITRFGEIYDVNIG